MVDICSSLIRHGMESWWCQAIFAVLVFNVKCVLRNMKYHRRNFSCEIHMARVMEVRLYGFHGLLSVNSKARQPDSRTSWRDISNQLGRYSTLPRWPHNINFSSMMHLFFKRCCKCVTNVKRSSPISTDMMLLINITTILAHLTRCCIMVYQLTIFLPKPWLLSNYRILSSHGYNNGSWAINCMLMTIASFKLITPYVTSEFMLREWWELKIFAQ